MKRVISLLLSVLMLTSVTAGLSFTAHASEHYQGEIELDTYYPMELRHFSDVYFYTFKPNQSGFYNFWMSSFLDHTLVLRDENNNTLESKGYEYDSYDSIDDSEENIAKGFDYYCKAGKTYNVLCCGCYGEYTGETLLYVKKSDIESIKYVPKEPFVIYDNDDWFYDEDENGNQELYHYLPQLNNIGDKLIVNKGGSETVYTHLENEEKGCVGYFSDDGEEFKFLLWYANDQYLMKKNMGINHIEAEIMGCPVDVQVEVIKNPIKSISLICSGGYKLYEDADRVYYGIEDGEWPYNCSNIFSVGDKIIIETNDSVEEYTLRDDGEYHNFYDKTGKRIDEYIEFKEDDSFYWSLGKHTVTISYKGFETDIEIEVVKNPVKSIKFTPAKPYRKVVNTDGYMEYIYDDVTDEVKSKYFEYNCPGVYQEGNVLTVVMKDGSEQAYTCTNKYGYLNYYDKNGKPLTGTIRLFDTQYTYHWEVGKKNNFILQYKGQRINVPIEIQKFEHDHEAASPVMENVKPATSAAEGSCDSVTYCKHCGIELSREKKILAKTVKKQNTLQLKAKTPTVNFKKLKKKNQSVSIGKAVLISGAQGKLTYSKAGGNKKISVNRNNGKITLKKGLKKGKYKVKIKVTAYGNSTYNAVTKTVTVTIRVK